MHASFLEGMNIWRNSSGSHWAMSTHNSPID